MRPLRRDARRSRDALLAAIAELLAEHGPDFTLTDAAQRAGLATATAYRHFTSVDAAIAAYYDQLLTGLVAAFDALPPAPDALAHVKGICQEWAVQAADWGPAAVYLRSPRGFLDRLAAADPLVALLYDRLSAALQAAVSAGALPAQDLRYATLTWVTLFDERVVVDLTHHHALTPPQAATALTATLLAALTAGTDF